MGLSNIVARISVLSPHPRIDGVLLAGHTIIILATENISICWEKWQERVRLLVTKVNHSPMVNRIELLGQMFHA